jgi:microcystin-dependent protein
MQLRRLSPKILCSALALGAGFIGFTPSTTQASSPQAYLGAVFPTLATYCPRNTAQANGQILSIISNQALFSLLGTYYGGDGRSTFALPDMRGRRAVGAGTGPGLTPTPLGSRRGQEEHILTVDNLPSHTHTASVSGTAGISVAASTSPGTEQTPSDGSYMAVGKQAIFKTSNYISPSDVTSTATLGGIPTTETGSVTFGDTGQASPYGIELRAPFLAIKYCIVTQGIYPPRPQ